MTDPLVQQGFDDGCRGVSLAELEAMSDDALADWQAGIPNGTSASILGEREWQRRLMTKQLHEQFRLDTRLAEAAERANRFTMLCVVAATLVGAIIGGVAILVGAMMQQTPSSNQPSSPSGTAQPKIAPTATPSSSAR